MMGFSSSTDDPAQPHVPEVLWAQRKSQVLITFNVQDVESPIVDIKPRHIAFEGRTVEGRFYKIDFELFDEIDPKTTRYTNLPRGLVIHASKVHPDADWWPRLVSGKKPFWLKVDFQHWVDEDDVDLPGEGFDMDYQDGDYADMPADLDNLRDAQDVLPTVDDMEEDEEGPAETRENGGQETGVAA